jgi:hypothetical protein
MHNTAHCHCGSVTVEVEGEPVRMAQCHCNACRRLSGTGHATWAFFPVEHVKISGEVARYQCPADSGATKARSFCPGCGAPLFTENSRTPERIGIAAAAFENSNWFQPQMIVYPWDMQVWDVVDEVIPKQERPTKS